MIRFFKKKHPDISVEKPASLAQANSFDRKTVGTIFNNLEVVASAGAKVSIVTCREKGTLVTTTSYMVSVSSHAPPPAIMFLRKTLPSRLRFASHSG